MKIILVIALVVVLSIIGIVAHGTTHRVEQADLDWCDECQGPCTWIDQSDPDHWMRDW